MCDNSIRDLDNPPWLQRDREEWGDGYDDDELAREYDYNDDEEWRFEQ